MLKKENLAVLVIWPTHRLKITLKLFSRQHQHQQKLIGSWIFGQYLGNTDSITLSLSDHKADGGKCWQSIPTPPFTQLSEWVAPNTLARLQCQRKYSSSLNYFLKEYFSSALSLSSAFPAVDRKWRNTCQQRSQREGTFALNTDWAEEQRKIMREEENWRMGTCKRSEWEIGEWYWEEEVAEGGLGIKNVGSNGGMGVGNWEGGRTIE